MDILETISQEIKSAMLAKDKLRLEALRGIKKELLEAKTAKGSTGDISEDTAVAIMQKMVKQRKDSAEIFTTQGRPELAEKELEEVKVIQAFLPAQMSLEEVETAIRQIVEQTGAESMKDMGKVMGVATKQLAGKTEGKIISELVKKVLS